MDTEKQRQCRCDDSRLTKSGDTRSEQLLVMPTETVRVAINQQRMASYQESSWVDQNVEHPAGFWI